MKVLMLGLLLVSGSAWVAQSLAGADDVYEIHNGFVTGERFLGMNSLQKRAFAMGIIDGVFLAPLFEAPKSEVQWFERCVEHMTDLQVATILEKYLADNPARWHQSAHTAMYSALRQSCPKQ